MEMRSGGRGQLWVRFVVNVVEERVGFGEHGAEDLGRFPSRVRRRFELETPREHLTEERDDGVTGNVEDRGSEVGGFVQHALEEFDKGRREASEIDIRKVVRAELLPRGTVVGEDNVRGSFENDESETEREGAIRQVLVSSAGKGYHIPEYIGLFPIPTPEDLGGNVFSIAFALEILGGVAVALAAHSTLSRLSFPRHIAVSSVPSRALHRGSAHDAQWIRSGPASRETKVSNLEVTSLRDEDVRGLEVEVENVARVHVRNSGDELRQDLPDPRLVELLVLASILFEPVREVATGTEFGLDEEVPSLFPRIDEGNEVRRRVLRV